MSPPAPLDAASNPAAIIRAFSTGTLFATDQARPIRYIVAGRVGRLVAPVDSKVFQAESVSLVAPEESAPGAIAMLLEPDQIVDWQDNEACDRWMAYHGKSDRSIWASMNVASLKWGGDVVDEDDIDLLNALHAIEPALCKRLNADRAKLAAACRTHKHVDVPDPLVVGVDQHGFDVRAPFGILRFAFSRLASDEATALAEIARLVH